MITPEELFRLIFLGYWGVMLVLILAMWLLAWKFIPKGNKWWVGLLGTLTVVLMFVLPMFKQTVKAKEENKVQEIQNEKYLAAKAVFDERCKTAGYKIYKTVENVEGVTLLNVWPDEKHYEDQMWEYAGLPKAFGGDSYIQGFLLWREWDNQINDYNYHGNGFSSSKRSIPYNTDEIKRYKRFNSYQFADVLQNQSYQRYQFKDLYYLNEIATTTIKKPSRYTVTFETQIIPEDRKIWIATTKAFVKDSQTDNLLGEATWYSFHGGQGVKKYSTTGIWDRARVCPDIANAQDGPIQYFVLKVLKPRQFIQENTNDNRDKK